MLFPSTKIVKGDQIWYDEEWRRVVKVEEANGLVYFTLWVDTYVSCSVYDEVEVCLA